MKIVDDGSLNTDFFMLCSRSSMPTWLPEVLRFLAWGSQTGWLGLVCPAHCSASLPLLAAVFVSGLSLGALLVVIFLWISPAITVPCPGVAPSPTSRPHREPSRLLAYLHERRRPYSLNRFGLPSVDFVLWHLLWRRPSIALINPVTALPVTLRIKLGLSLLLDFLLTRPLLGILCLLPQWFNQLLSQLSYPLQAIGHLLYLQAALWVQTFPLSLIIELLLPLTLCLAIALTCVFAWVVQRKRSSFEHVVLGKLDFGQRPLWKVLCLSLDLPPSSIFVLRSISSSGLLLCLGLFGWTLLLSTSDSFHLSQALHLSPTALLLWPKPVFTVQELALPLRTHNDFIDFSEDPGLGSKLVVYPIMATWCINGPGGRFCDPHLHSWERRSHGCSFGFDSSRDFDFRVECPIGGPCRSFVGGQVPSSSGVGEWRGDTPGSRGQCGLCGGGSSLDEGVRSSHGSEHRDPAFLARTAGDFAVIGLPSGASFTGSLLFRGGNGGRSKVCSTGSQEDCPEARDPAEGQEGDHGRTGRAVGSFVGCPSIDNYSVVELLQNNQAKLESALHRPQAASQAAHKLDFLVPLGNANLDVKSFASAVGPPPRTNFSIPLRQQARETLPEDEPMLDPQQDGFKPATPFPTMAGAPTGTAQAFIQQSQAMTALVAHLIGNQDPMNDLALSSSSSSSLSSKGAARREKLQTELANRSGNFMLSVAQNAFRRMRPTDPMPASPQDFQGRSLFTRYFREATRITGNWGWCNGCSHTLRTAYFLET